MARRISVVSHATSVIEGLNQIVRAHGALMWGVSYCKPPALYEHATISLMTFDSSGIGGHAVFLRDANGKPYDPCARR